MERAEDLYLDLLEKCLTRTLHDEDYSLPMPPRSPLRAAVHKAFVSTLKRRGLVAVRPIDPAAREAGQDWPLGAETMLGRHRLACLRRCVVQILTDRVPGDLLEAGAWRGGAAILMKGVLAAYGDEQRNVWVADSFAGLPKPDAERYPHDAGDRLWTADELAVSVAVVKANFARYGVLDERVRFLEGWFSETLPSAPIERLALVHLDGDLYESIIVPLQALYSKVSPGGYIVVDDYSILPACRAAVDDFRRAEGIDEPLERIDWNAVLWRRSSA